MLDVIPAKGVVGEDEDTCILHVRSEGTEQMRGVIRVTARNLCSSHGAIGTLLVGAEPRISQVNLNDTKMHLETEVDPGQDVVLVVHLVRVSNDMCIRLGETEFELDLVAY